MKTLQSQYPVRVMCRVFDVSRSGYHAFASRSPSKRAQENARLEVAIQVAHARTRQTYGPERLQAELKDEGIKAGVGRIKRLRQKLGLCCKQVRKFKTTTNSNQMMSEGKETGAVDASKPLLTYSRPKGEYKDGDAIMIDFWLSNAKLTGDGGEYRVKYSVDGGEAKFIDKWSPIWLKGWTDGKHSVKLELVNKEGNFVDNGGYNSTTREITITK